MELDPRYRWYKVSLPVVQEKNKKHVVGKKDFYFRGLTCREIRIAGYKPDKYQAEDYVLSTCVLDPPNNWDYQLAYTTLQLIKEIYKCSGIDDEAVTFTEAYGWISDEVGLLEAIAVAMIPSVTLELLENCDPFNYAKYLAIAKFQFETMYGIPIQDAFKTGEEGDRAQESHLTTRDQITRDQRSAVDVTSFSWKKGQDPF